MRYIELFAGIGGFRLGIEKAYQRLGRDGQKSVRVSGGQETLDSPGVNSPQDKRPDRRTIDSPYPETVFANEWDKYSAQTYNKNFGGQIDQRDITTVPTSDIPDHDLLVGGFPCQAFSVAGKRLGFNDTRGTLFFEIARILRDKKPRNFLLENVKGLLSHDEGKTFQTILGVLSDLGYFVEWQVLNSKDFGVPQNRERVFLIGYFGGEPRPKVFPIGGEFSLPTTSQRETRQTTATALRAKQGGPDIDQTYIAPTIRATEYKHGDNQTLVAERTPLRFLERNQKKIEGDYSFTGDSSNTGGVKQGMRIRRLTPIECERLQGFPDNWTAGVSDTQRYKQLGNAVTTNVVQAIIERLIK